MDLPMIDPKQSRQLFIDDSAVESMEGIRRALHQPKKFGPVINGGIQSRSCPQWNPEKDLWEWWYMGQHIYYATSTDGEHWEKPNLGLYEWEGPKDNNITCDPEAPRIMHIIRDDNDPDTQQYLALVKHHTEWDRSVFLSTSKDFNTFTEPELIFHSDEIDWENCRQRVRRILDDPAYISPPIVDDEDYFAEVYNMAVLPYNGLYVGFPTIFNPFGAIPPPETNHTRINQIEVRVSHDLHHWQRVADNSLFIEAEPWNGDNYGTCQLLMAGHPIVRDDGEIWVCYNALRMPASAAAKNCSAWGSNPSTSRTAAPCPWPSCDPTVLCRSTATNAPPSSPSPSCCAARTSTSTPQPSGAPSTPKLSTPKRVGPTPATGCRANTRRRSATTARAPKSPGSTQAIASLKDPYV